MQDFKRLDVWAKAHALMLNVNRELRCFPREYANLRSQLRRAAESIPTNIVEGSARRSQREFANFLQISFSSCSEVEYHLRVANDYGILKKRAWESLTRDTIEVRMMLSGLIQRVRGESRSVPSSVPGKLTAER
jgi:four helix bundle protein